ncbi:MAG TPA: glycosyltransferase family 39 protein [Isosphaeraceae bacterium]|jgi:hypothetical protein|nr:glycosyltransferase family 39 protein [Isosphaeraceae bacterium]
MIQRNWAIWAITLLLGAAAATYQGYHLTIALDADDTNHLETPLLLAVARQATEGPGTLYGPYSGSSPLVLIHAPLYYRLAGLAAWPLTRAGYDAITAALIAGRSLSLLGVALLLLAVARLARFEGESARSGVWATLIVAASPVLGSFGVTVRPDTLGIALQTWGIWFILRSLREGCGAWKAGLLFALAVCVKQHDLVSGVVGFGLLALPGGRGRARRFVGAVAVGVGILGVYGGLEEWLTGGMMSRAVVRVPAALGRVNRATWGHVATVFLETAKLSIGLLALAGACLVSGMKGWRGGRLDAILGLFLVAETAAMVPLCLNSTGSWVNYALEPVVLGAVLVARALDRVVSSGSGWRLGPVVLASAALLAADVRLVRISAGNRAKDREALRTLLADPALGPRESRYFVAVPQYNRLYGRAELAHDDWLYSSFEAVGAAEPRSGWLRSALTTGPVRRVVVANDPHRDPMLVEGLAEPLPLLGYRKVDRFGRFDLWERCDANDPDRLTARNRPDRWPEPR